jgi:SNF2 family DNA or RNA helicase
LPQKSTIHIPVGKICCGELYITNLKHWKNDILVRVLYEDAVGTFYPIFSNYPYLTSIEELRLRNLEQEQELLNQLTPHYRMGDDTVSLDSYDVDLLRYWTQNNWKIYVEKEHGNCSRLHVREDKSGIIWFSTNTEETDNDIVSNLLEAYLHNRNYQEFDGNVTIFKKDNAINLTNDTLITSLFVHKDLTEFYKKGILLQSSEKKLLLEKLKVEFHANLRHYQVEGVVWLKEMRLNHRGCLLADEMGLGKTLQILAHLSTIDNQQYPHLIIAPTSLIANWYSELQRFMPQWKDEVDIQPQTPNVHKSIVLVSYDILRIHIANYQNIKYDTIVIDEAQIIKNSNTKKHQAISSLNSHHRIILTGTPIENSIVEIWSHFLILIPEMQNLLDGLRRIGIGVHDSRFLELSGKLLKPFILRRTKDEVLNDLPEKLEKNVFITLNKHEQAIYDKTQSIFIRAIETGISGRINSIALEGLLRLRQTCVSSNILPLTLNNGERFISSKMRLALDYIEQFKEEGNKVLIFSQFVRVLQEMEKYLQERSISFVNLYGNTLNRALPIRMFQTEKSITAFLISLRAGGVGLNLTAADRVLMLDDWWNPAVEEQAFSRAHRIGQKNKVLILRLVCKDTVEEKILQLQERKRQTVDLFNATSDKLTIEELKQLIY